LSSPFLFSIQPSISHHMLDPIEKLNPIIKLLDRRLRLAVIGGGPGSFIGAMHRQAARLDDRYDIVAAALSSDPQLSKKAGAALGLPLDRCYASATELLSSEAKRPDRADVVAIMTPNDSHYSYAKAALDLGFDVICDKPMTNTLQEATDLHHQVKKSGLIFCLTHNYTGYPMVRQARAMVDAGLIGKIGLVQVEYVQGGRAKPGPGRRAWKEDPLRGGPSLVMGDIGTHAHNLLRFITSLEVHRLGTRARLAQYRLSDCRVLCGRHLPDHQTGEYRRADPSGLRGRAGPL
jgi:predicted dehydrogenase